MKRSSLIRRGKPVGVVPYSVGGAMMFSGCLVIPVDYHSKGSRQNISDKTQSLLQPGVTTKEEVFLLLGEPDYAFDDGQHIGYAWKK
jgi:hypothetical protein